MIDPDRDEMIEALSNYFVCLDQEVQGAKEIAIYWFASHWHGGQSSNLYSVLSTSPYKPGPNTRLETEDEMVQDMYNVLETTFTHQERNTEKTHG